MRYQIILILTLFYTTTVLSQIPSKCNFTPTQIEQFAQKKNFDDLLLCASYIGVGSYNVEGKPRQYYEYRLDYDLNKQTNLYKFLVFWVYQDDSSISLQISDKQVFVAFKKAFIKAGYKLLGEENPIFNLYQNDEWRLSAMAKPDGKFSLTLNKI